MQKNTTDKTKSPSLTKSVICCLCSFISWQKKTIIQSAQANILKWKRFGQKLERHHSLPPVFALLIDLYDGKDVFSELEESRINPDYSSKYFVRNDLEYYLPQLTNFMIFHDDLCNKKLNDFLENLSKADPYFAHLYYWYTNSLSLATDDTKAKNIIDSILFICSREAETQVFLKDYQRFYLALQKKLSKEDFEGKIKDIQSRQAKMYSLIQQYKEGKFDTVKLNYELKASDIELKPYISPILQGDEAYSSNPFTSTLLFFEDLYTAAQELNKTNEKLKCLKRYLNKINHAFPSSVYIPFVKDSIRCCAVLGIVVSETKIFSTKERAPFYVCLELFKPQEELVDEYNSIFYSKNKNQTAPNLISWAKKKLKITQQKKYEEEADEVLNVKKLSRLGSSPLKTKDLQDTSGLSPIKDSEEICFEKTFHNHVLADINPLDLSNREGGEITHTKSSISNVESSKRHTHSPDCKKSETERSENDINNDTPVFKGMRFPRFNSMGSNHASPGRDSFRLNDFAIKEEEKDTKNEEIKVQNEEFVTEGFTIDVQPEKDPFFGEDSQVQRERIKSKSPFKNLKTWRLLHLIVKAGADMKEEQFALQLISQFQQIFKAEKLKLILTPFEIISLGPDIGLVEFVKDTVTLSSLKEKMYQQNIPTLSQFFEHYYGKDVEKARKRFCRSLAAYSLICYFLQIKDRHNGNIMLHKKGHILHLDFGFFFSNAPGRGLEFERKVPFKLLNEYIEVLGGPRSSMFQEFRRLFYKGFVAAHKHREQILILVKMMYSSQGNNLPCFKAGLKSITELEQRFCPPGVSEKDFTSYCYNLINQSLDNWRARCYDKYQYYMQGIFY